MEKIKQFFKKNWIYLVLFVGLFALCYIFPYSHDDWAWGSNIGIDRLKNNFAGYNGRWMGNLVVLALTRFNILKAFVMSLVLVLTIYFLNNILSKKNKMIVYISILLLLAVPFSILKQAIVWTAGFSNYAASIFMVLWYLYINRNILDEEYNDKWYKMVGCLILGFTSALFVEHITIYLVLLSLAVLIYHKVKYKKIKISHIAYLIGVIAGVVLMFSNSAYSNVSSGADEYRSFELANFISSSIDSYFDTIYLHLIFNNYLLNVLLSTVIISYFIKNIKKIKQQKLVALLILILVSFPLYSLLYKFSGVAFFLRYTKYFNGLFAAVYYLAVFASCLFIKDKIVRNKNIFIIISIALMTAPLFVVTPIGSRCFLPMYIFWMWILLEYIALLNIKENKFINISIVGLILTYSLYLFSIYGYIFINYTKRINYLNKQEDKVVVLPKLPYEKYVHCGDPINEEFERRFKLFYNAEDKEITFVPLKEWKKIK